MLQRQIFFNYFQVNELKISDYCSATVRTALYKFYFKATFKANARRSAAQLSKMDYHRIVFWQSAHCKFDVQTQYQQQSQ